MKKLPILILMATCLILQNCRNTKDAAESQADYKTIATEKLGENVKFTPNQDNSMILCYSVKEGQNLGAPGVSFLVYDNRSKSIIYEDRIDKGTVNWYSGSQLALFNTPGLMRKDQTRDDFTYIYDLIKKERTLKTELVETDDN